jgi:hypothetical protein
MLALTVAVILLSVDSTILDNVIVGIFHETTTTTVNMDVRTIFIILSKPA